MNKNTKTALGVFGIVAFMIGLAFASVPLYDAFCRITGFGGTPQLSTRVPAADEILAREMTVTFNTDTAQNLPWAFEAEKGKVTLPIGAQHLINFKAKNQSARPVTGTAVYNVVPAKAGQYFHKTDRKSVV